jgi:preprotein translocase subunit SecA
MDLQAAWDKVTDVGSAAGELLNKALLGVFGNSNERQVRRLRPRVEAINALEKDYEKLSDAELKGLTAKFRERLAKGATLDDLLVEAFAAVREAGKRFLKMRHYDVQMIGGMVLHSGKIAEMVTGEGKTLVATLPTYLNALAGRGVHVVTVNDYLARRDAEWMSPLFNALGMTIGAIQSNMDSADRIRHYQADITYGTANEFGFDYLRDNMKQSRESQCQKELHYAIIDEVDSILIDEARTPLIISGPALDDPDKYRTAHRVALQLRKDTHFEVKEKEHTCHLTDVGVLEAEKLVGVESFYTVGNMEWPHLIDNALKAVHLYRRDKHYLVRGDEVIIIDEHTDRAMEGRQWSDGLHQAVEAKEAGAGVRIKQETQTLATVTLQNFFKLYRKLAGMTGTAMTEANEFYKIYKLDVVAIPTNKPLIRKNSPDVIFCTEREKWNAVLEEVKLVRRTGRPILIGTSSVGFSEMLSDVFKRNGIKHEVLNAKFVERESEIVAQAGRRSAITISTNMAGRGTDIILGGNPDMQAWADIKHQYPTRLEVPAEVWRDSVAKYETPMKAEGRELVKVLPPADLAKSIETDEPADKLLAAVAGLTQRDFAEVDTFDARRGYPLAEKLAAKHGVKDVDALNELLRLMKAADPGGLHIIGTERHESRRIDNQLRGRSGRQGDPGSSRFFLALEDDLMRKFAGDWVRAFLQRLGMQDGEAIESPLVSRQIQGAQKKVEERNFEIRKQLLEYDEIMDVQRKRVYGFRQTILEGRADTRRIIRAMIGRQVGEAVKTMMHPDYAMDTFAAWLGDRLSIEFKGRQFRRTSFGEAERIAKDSALQRAHGLIHDAVAEHLNVDADEKEWNWEALASWAGRMWNIKVRGSELKRIERDLVDEHLVGLVEPIINGMELDEGKPFFEPGWAKRSLVGFMVQRFDLRLTEADVSSAPNEADPMEKWLLAKVEGAYIRKDVEFPVTIGLSRYAGKRSDGSMVIDREGLINWANSRFQAKLTEDEFRNVNFSDIEKRILEASATFYGDAAWSAEIEREVTRVFAGARKLPAAKLSSLVGWAKERFGITPAFDRPEYDLDEAISKVSDAAYGKYRPEMAQAERELLLQFIDMGWKDHLYAMDHLRSGIGLVGYASIDPKVEYKRKGRQIFEEMWASHDRKVLELVFHMEELDVSFARNIWQITNVEHEAYQPGDDADADAGVAGNIRGQQDAASRGQGKIETIRNSTQKVGRNDPCPCGSGKKYKSCCMRASA